MQRRESGPESKYRLVRHNEIQPSNMEPGMVVITIEHCTDCDKHDYTTRHDAAKYMDYVGKVQDAINDAFPFIVVALKPTKDLSMKESPVQVDGSLCWSMGREGAQLGKWPREVSPAGFCTPRLGALEVQMAVWPQGENLPKVSLVHSKLASNTWPKTDRVIKTIAGRLPAKLIKVTVQVFDYEDGTPDEVPAPEKMILTAAAGARVETTELIRESDTPPVTQVEVPMGCDTIVCAATETTLASAANISSAVSLDGTAHGVQLLRIPVHTCPMIRCVIRVAGESDWDPSLGLITATKPVAGSEWVAESPLTDSGEAWLFPPSDAAHVACAEVTLTLSVGSGHGAWRRVDTCAVHPYGTTNLLVEFPTIRQVTFAPKNERSGEDVDGMRVRLVAVNGQTTPERDWTGAEPYFMEPGSYDLVLRADGFFDKQERITVDPPAPGAPPVGVTLDVAMRQKTLKTLGKEEMEVDEVPQRMLSLWTPSKGAGELDMCFVVEESATLKPCVLTLNRTLGGGGGPSEIAQFIAELPACSTAPQIGITSFKGITAAMLNPPDDGGKSKDRKKPEEIKQDAVNVRLPLSSNAAGLKIGVQALDVTGARDETRLALAEVVKLTLGNLSWRRDSARVVILVGDATPIDGADTLSPQQVAAATPQEAAEWLPETWAAAAESLRANSVRVCACVVGGPDVEGTPGSYALDAGFARAYAALAAVTGGLVGAMPARAMGSTVVSVAAAEVALHQQTVDDLAATDDFKWRLQPLLDGEAVLEDRDGAIRQMMNVFTTTATAMNDAGLLGREFWYHPETGMPQVVCTPVKPHHVALALRSNAARGVLATRADVVDLLKKCSLSTWLEQ